MKDQNYWKGLVTALFLILAQNYVNRVADPVLDFLPFGARAEATATPFEIDCKTYRPASEGNQSYLEVRRNAQSCWVTDFAPVNPAESLEIQLSYWNLSDIRRNNVVAKVELPAGVLLAPKSTYLKNGNNPDGTLMVSDNVSGQGINVGDYNPGAAAYVKSTIKVVNHDYFNCGSSTLPMKLVFGPVGEGLSTATAFLRVVRVC